MTPPRPRIRSKTVGGVALALDFSHHVRHGPSCSHERDTASLPPTRRQVPQRRLTRTQPKADVASPIASTVPSRPRDGQRAPRGWMGSPHSTNGTRRAARRSRSRQWPSRLLRRCPLIFRSPCRGAFPSCGLWRRPKAGMNRTMRGQSWQAPLGTEYGGAGFFKQCGCGWMWMVRWHHAAWRPRSGGYGPCVPVQAARGHVGWPLHGRMRLPKSFVKHFKLFIT